jgi:hypothetical protein
MPMPETMKAHHGRKASVLLVAIALVVPAGASASPLSISHARKVAVTKMKNMERKLKGEGAKDSSVRGCWREGGKVGCLGMVRGKDDFLRWQCAVPMTIRKRPTASAAQARVAVKFTDPMCSF